MSAYRSDVTDEQWVVLAPLLVRPGQPGPKHKDLHGVVNAIFYVAHTGCQWRFLPSEFGVWTRIWSQFRRWTVNGTWARALAGAHRRARAVRGRPDPLPSMIVIDTQLARGGSNGGRTFHTRGGPYGATNRAKRIVAVDVTGLAIAAQVVPANIAECRTVRTVLRSMVEAGQTGRLELVLVDKGTSVRSCRELSVEFGVEVRQVGWPSKSPVFRPIRHAWRVEVAHGRLARSRRLAKSWENTTRSASGWLQVVCLTDVLRVRA